MSEVSHSAEWSALEKTITNKFGAGHGTTVLLGLLKKLHDGQALLEPPVVTVVPGLLSEATIPQPEEVVIENTATSEVTESSP